MGPLTMLRDEWLIRSMMKRVGDLPESMFLPMLRLLAPDRDAVDAGWAQVIGTRQRHRRWESPSKAWERHYGQFVRELEFTATGLRAELGLEATTELISDAVAARLNRWLRVMMPMFGSVKLVPDAIYSPVMDAGVAFATFLVGPIHAAGEEPDGTLLYEIPECAMHTVAGTGSAQENSCLMGCKASCEKVFHAGGPMPLEFDPHLPGLSCTLRVRKAT
ncbi:hypothetical protein CQY22_001750 [Mycolicibacterium brumae]|uniref:Uncharacterized protein n=2 Tax=Mycolicibacterium brumae TaxID=85968 RepID=A0A2G5PHA5_9MYCO|nr:hypothetical protein CQY22_001750 [Mycolicibacterium brumae]RWA20115.1 hypothetical protein MBRU_15895 [Mycolicibacterium brumae DSM 44177]